MKGWGSWLCIRFFRFWDGHSSPSEYRNSWYLCYKVIPILTEHPQKYPLPEVKLMLLTGLRATFRALWPTSGLLPHNMDVVPLLEASSQLACLWLTQRLPLGANFVIGPGVSFGEIKRWVSFSACPWGCPRLVGKTNMQLMVIAMW